MKTQISRDSFAPEQRYSGVYLQQGRMILDADWNEWTEVQKARLVDALRDAVASGAPRSGGLRLIADPPGSTNVRLQPGALYVDGVPARVDAAAPLLLTAQPQYPLQADFSGQNLKLYADVWERCVTALERSALLDPALHGADTATRSQTMLQVKACPADKDPLDPAYNPPMGDAPLSLALRKISSGADVCDPCAVQVKVDERLGNYLFRVEVHDVDLATQTLTLKWSRDNGAEAANVGQWPVGFDQGDWVWEFFDDDTERLLGLHFAPNPKKVRGLIKESCVPPVGADEPKTRVRQWDGYARLRLDTGALLAGRDRGAALVVGAAADPAHGRVVADPGAWQVNLESLSLQIRLTGQRFVPGDHWLATVREATQVSGDTVLDQGRPLGVRHHFVVLGELGADRKLKPVDDAMRRRMSFPPLTDLTAADIGFTDHCPGLFAGAVNVQQALDTLCAIGAEDISYTLPNCASSPNVRELLGLAGVSAKVSQVLDKLLCELRANDLPLDKSDAGLCPDLQAPGVVTVQDALKALCARSGGCEVAVKSSEQLTQLLKQAAELKAGSLWIKLCAGSYQLDGGLVLTGLNSLRLSGECLAAVTVTLTGSLSLSAGELTLEQLSLRLPATGQLLLGGNAITAQQCSVQRIASAASANAMVVVGGLQGGGCRLLWRGNPMQARVRSAKGFGWAPAAVVDDDAFVKAINSLMKASTTEGTTPAVLKAAQAKAADAWIALPAARRAVWQSALKQARLPDLRTVQRAGVTVQADRNQISSALSATALDKAAVAVALDGLALLSAVDDPDYALRLADPLVGGTIEGCEIDGWVLMANGVTGVQVPSAAIKAVAVEGDVVQPLGADLHLRDNQLLAVHANLPKAALNADGTLVARVPGHGRIFLVGNRLGEQGSVFTAGSWLAQGNTWWYEPRLGFLPGLVIGHRASFNGNVIENYTDNSVVATTARIFANGSNALIDLLPIP